MNRRLRLVPGLDSHLLQEETMNRSIQAVTLTAALGLAGTASADYIVNDTWADGSRTDPAGPVYSEFGVDADVDGDLESAWFASSGTLNGTEGNPITPG